MRAFILAAVTLVTGCKDMGALGHGLRHVARIASMSGKVLAPVVRTAVRAAPILIDTAVAVSSTPVVVVDGEVVEHDPGDGGPLIDNGDPCGYCPDDRACDACGDADGNACLLTPPGAYARCESPHI